MIDGNALFRSAVDELAPPAPPEAIEDRDDDGGDPCTCPAPVLVVLEDGSLSAHRWGLGLLAWLGVSTGVTALWLLSAVTNVVMGGPTWGLRAGLVLGAFTAFLAALVLFLGLATAFVGKSMPSNQRAPVVGALVSLASLLGWCVARWWLP
ncbi:MAG: hypothetical protein AB7P40_00155 [Chloroflexota bacterium]